MSFSLRAVGSQDLCRSGSIHSRSSSCMSEGSSSAEPVTSAPPLPHVQGSDPPLVVLHIIPAQPEGQEGDGGYQRWRAAWEHHCAAAQVDEQHCGSDVRNVYLMEVPAEESTVSILLPCGSSLGSSSTPCSGVAGHEGSNSERHRVWTRPPTIPSSAAAPPSAIHPGDDEACPQHFLRTRGLKSMGGGSKYLALAGQLHHPCSSPVADEKETPPSDDADLGKYAHPLANAFLSSSEVAALRAERQQQQQVMEKYSPRHASMGSHTSASSPSLTAESEEEEDEELLEEGHPHCRRPFITSIPTAAFL